MNYQSKQMVARELIKVANSAPELYSRNRWYGYNNNSTFQSQNIDISLQEFRIWRNYVDNVLDISYDYIKFDAILSTKLKVSQLSSQYGVSNTYRIGQIKSELLNLAQLILQL